jgi:hypothetical protein
MKKEQILAEAKKAIAENPAKITAAEFLAMIAENPSVFEHWNTPLEITEYVECKNSPITHLSPHLTFSGKDFEETSASFYKCKNLKRATGNFKGTLLIWNSGIETIENLHVGKDKYGYSASFPFCQNLQIASGNFEGFVSFEKSGIKKIENLNVGKDKAGISASFCGCPNLKIATGDFPGLVDFSESGVEKIVNLNAGKHEDGISADFLGCKNLKIATGNFEGFAIFLHSGIDTIHNLNIKTPHAIYGYADFNGCPNLQTLEGWDISKTIHIEPQKLEAEIKRQTTLKKPQKSQIENPNL